MRRVVQKFGQPLNDLLIVPVGEGVHGGSANLRLLRSSASAQNQFRLSGLPVLAKFQRRQRGHAHCRSGVAKEFQGRAGIDVQRLAQRFHFGQQTAGVQSSRPVRTPGKLMGQLAGAAQRWGARVVQTLHGKKNQRHD
jgi:hypothetical protein